MKTLYEDDQCPGRKHKGKTIGDVAGLDPKYLHQLQATSRTYCISDEVMDNLDKYRLLRLKTKPGQRLLGTAQGAEDD